MPHPRRYTPDEVRALPDDGKRYETVHGELLVTPAPGGKHQFVLERLRRALGEWLAARGLEQLLASPADISIGTDSLVQPDLFVADLSEFIREWDWKAIRRIYLAVEVVSPSSARSDRTVKRRLYQEARIAEYWVVDAEQRHIEVWTPDAAFPVVVQDVLRWRHPMRDDVMEIDVAKLFDVGGS